MDNVKTRLREHMIRNMRDLSPLSPVSGESPFKRIRFAEDENIVKNDNISKSDDSISTISS